MNWTGYIVAALAVLLIGIGVIIWIVEAYAASAGNPGSKRPAYICVGVGSALLLLLLGGCAATATPPREVTVIKEVPVPYHQPCPAEADKPVVPKRVAEENPAMPKLSDGSPDWHGISRILGSKVLELFGYAGEADAVIQECSKPRGASPPR